MTESSGGCRISIKSKLAPQLIKIMLLAFEDKYNFI